MMKEAFPKIAFQRNGNATIAMKITVPFAEFRVGKVRPGIGVDALKPGPTLGAAGERKAHQ